MRKVIYLYLAISLWALLPFAGSAQVSHGGQPLPRTHMRSNESGLYQEMPPFDVAEQLRIDSLNESDLRSGHRFAYKFMTDFTPANSGVSFTLADGTRVWQLGIHSPGALSINVLFSEYELPEGAQLFLYDEERTQVLGAFTHQNNSEQRLLPIAPVRGDRLVIEYQEPADAPFHGKLTVGEVNHAYRDFRGKEPSDNNANITQIPPLACYTQEEEWQRWGRSVVLLVIDGSVTCTGTLINNTEGDGKPYLLTASHCLNKNFTLRNPDYEQIAGSIVCFYNYDSPFCSPILRGTEEMSTASSHFRAVNEQADMALLELTETPPAYYRPYYAGWNAQVNAGEAPFLCPQHPSGSVKRISVAEEAPSYITFHDPTIRMDFYENAHWHITHWADGYTASGSSGAPLLNASGKVIGALTGGASSASQPENDYFYALSKAWTPADEPNRQLKYWLNPADDSTLTCEGLDPYASAPYFRLSNASESGIKEQAEVTPYSGDSTAYLFGNNPSGITEYAERYKLSEQATLDGAYLVTPAAGSDYEQMEVEITVYDASVQPYTLLYKERFQPAYTSKSVIGNDFTDTRKSLDRAQESYIHFSQPISVKGDFMVGYKLNYLPENCHFATYNLPQGTTTRNTAWLRTTNGWVAANEYAAAGFNTSLLIDPVVQYGDPVVSNEQIGQEGGDERLHVHVDSQGKTIHILLPPGVEQGDFAIYSVRGELCAQGKLTGNKSAVLSGQLGRGIYLLHINYDEKSQTRKIML